MPKSSSGVQLVPLTTSAGRSGRRLARRWPRATAAVVRAVRCCCCLPAAAAVSRQPVLTLLAYIIQDDTSQCKLSLPGPSLCLMCTCVFMCHLRCLHDVSSESGLGQRGRSQGIETPTISKQVCAPAPSSGGRSLYSAAQQSSGCNGSLRTSSSSTSSVCSSSTVEARISARGRSWNTVAGTPHLQCNSLLSCSGPVNHCRSVLKSCPSMQHMAAVTLHVGPGTTHGGAQSKMHWSETSKLGRARRVQRHHTPWRALAALPLSRIGSRLREDPRSAHTSPPLPPARMPSSRSIPTCPHLVVLVMSCRKAAGSMAAASKLLTSPWRRPRDCAMMV